MSKEWDEMITVMDSFINRGLCPFHKIELLEDHSCRVCNDLLKGDE